MYEKHYGLTEKPFSIIPNPKVLFLGENHEKALTYLEYGLREKVGFILLTGEIGSGKTTLIRHVLNQVESQMEIAVIFNTNFSSDQLFRRILSEFEIPFDDSESDTHVELLYQFLIDCYARKRHVLLIIDEAQNLSDDAIESIRMLSNLQTDSQLLLQIMLVGQPELGNRLQMPAFQQMAQRIAVNFHIPPLDEPQTIQYIVYRIQKAGGIPDLFSTTAMKKIYRYSGGIPRSINLLCDTSLVYGFSDGLDSIGRSVVEKVIQDKVCMPAGQNGGVGKATETRGISDGGSDIDQRLKSLEGAILEVRRMHEEFTKTVTNDLLIKYKGLLAAERKRYDDLLDRYTQLSSFNASRTIMDEDIL